MAQTLWRRLVGRGTGPEMEASVAVAASMILSHAAFMWLTSKDLSLMRIFAAATEAWRGRRAGDGM